MVQLWSLALEVLFHACYEPMAADKDLIASPSTLLCRIGRLLTSSERPGGRVQHLAQV